MYKKKLRGLSTLNIFNYIDESPREIYAASYEQTAMNNILGDTSKVRLLCGLNTNAQI